MPRWSELEVGRGKGLGAGFLCQPFHIITQDLLQKTARVSRLMQLSSRCAGKGYSGEASISLDVGIPVVPSTCRVLLRRCSTD